MLDTNIFNRLVKEEAFDMTALANLCRLGETQVGRWLATDIQLDELRQTKDEERRNELVLAFHETGAERLPAASFAFDIEGAGWDQAHWNDGSGLIERMLTRLAEIELGVKKRRRQTKLAVGETDLNPYRDILIAETAMKAGATLVTGDEHLCQVAVEFGIRVLYAPPQTPT